MRLLSLVRRDVLHYWQTNLAVVAGVGVAVAVLAGALLVGASVRASLRAIALERLGAVDTVVTSVHFVPGAFSTDLLSSAALDGRFAAAAPLVAVEGFVTHQPSGRRAGGVQVYGVDERFWRFHGAEPSGFALDASEAFVSAGLARELEAEPDDPVLVRIERPTAVPISSLHGRRDDTGETLRLGVARVLGPAAHGEFSFRPQQGLARSVFVPLERLQQEIDRDAQVNTILLGDPVPTPDEEAGARLAAAEDAVREVATLSDMGLRVRELPEQGVFILEAASGLIDDGTAEIASTTATSLGFEVQPVMTYLANQVRHGDRLTPYSLVTGIELGAVSSRAAEEVIGGTGDPVVLNDWIAEDLDAEVGDDLQLVYYVWEDEGHLVTRQADLRVVDVVPMAGLAADPTLAPDYPGITEATDVGSWDPPFEIDLGLIRERDETYWDEHRTTPKAFVPVETAQRLWDSRWGALTSLRFQAQAGVDADAERFRRALRDALDPIAGTFVVYPARTLALEASAGTTDFGLYFIYFSFFLVVSALLLASLFFRVGVEQRLAQIGLLRAAGFPPGQVWRLFTLEGLVLSVAGSVVGVAAAIVYAELIMLGLRTWWVDAVGTTRLSLHVGPVWLAVGAAGGVVAAVASIGWTLRTLAPISPRSLLSGVMPVAGRLESRAAASRAMMLAAGLAALGVVMVGAAVTGLVGATAGFFGGGLALLCAVLAFTWGWLHGGPRRTTRGPWSVSQVGFRNATSRPGRSVLCIALIASATFIIVAVDAFRRSDTDGGRDPRSGTGGFTLLAESLVPLAHNPSTPEGQQALFLGDLFTAGEALEDVRFARFRVRPGEDASCLNLYQAQDPRLLGVPGTFVEQNRFSFAESMAETTAAAENPWQLLDRRFDDGAIPAIADATSLTYALHLSVGDDLVLNPSTDRPIRLRIVAALADSLFQRELLIGEAAFERVFPEYDGYRFFLIDAPAERTGAVAAALEDRLADFGFDVASAPERLAAFHRVENTYLATFQTLGGLGLVLGTFGLGAVLLRNVLERRRELALLRAVGYNAGHLSLMVLAENAFLLGSGLVAGTACAVLAIAPAWLERGEGLPILSLGALLTFVVAAGFIASLGATIVAIRSPLLRALRTE